MDSSQACIDERLCRTWQTRNPMNPPSNGATVHSEVSLLTANDLYLFNEGSHYRIYDKLGAHAMEVGGEAGTCFGLWAPNAQSVSVIGSFNGWDPRSHKLLPRGSSGIWEGFIPGVHK